MNSNNSAIPNFSVTNYISYESSISQLFADMFYIQIRLHDKIGGLKDYHSAGTFSRSIARMTSQIRPLWLINRRGGLHWLLACQGLKAEWKKAELPL